VEGLAVVLAGDDDAERAWSHVGCPSCRSRLLPRVAPYVRSFDRAPYGHMWLNVIGIGVLPRPGAPGGRDALRVSPKSSGAAFAACDVEPDVRRDPLLQLAHRHGFTLLVRRRAGRGRSSNASACRLEQAAVLRPIARF
jgi:hypothetical protein